MANIKIKFRDGTLRKFMHEGRAGGSYTKTLRYEHGFIVIVDEYYKETAIPHKGIKEIVVTPNR